MKTQDDIQTLLLPVLGMTCAACANSVESMIGSQQGVEKAEVNYATQTVKVSYHPDQVQPPAFQKAVQSIGYDLIMDSENGKEKQEEVQQKNYSSLKRRMIASGILALPVVLIGMFFMDISYANYYMLALTTPVLFIFGK
ncbi:MAG: cation transporter, partial [Bacteroidia bacterium]